MQASFHVVYLLNRRFCYLIFLAISHFQIYVISLAEPRLPLQLDDAVRPEVEGEEVKFMSHVLAIDKL